MITIRSLIVYFCIVHNLYLLSVGLDLSSYVFWVRLILTFGLIISELIELPLLRDQIRLESLLIISILALGVVTNKILIQSSVSVLYCISIALTVLLPKENASVAIKSPQVMFAMSVIIFLNLTLVSLPYIYSSTDVGVSLVGWIYIVVIIGSFIIESVTSLYIKFATIIFSAIVPVLSLLSGCYNIFDDNLKYGLYLSIVSILCLCACVVKFNLWRKYA